jgi:hypothetical protein
MTSLVSIQGGDGGVMRRIILTFAEITEAGGCRPCYAQHGIDLSRPYREWLGNGLAVVEQEVPGFDEQSDRKCTCNRSHG